MRTIHRRWRMLQYTPTTLCPLSARNSAHLRRSLLFVPSPSHRGDAAPSSSELPTARCCCGAACELVPRRMLGHLVAASLACEERSLCWTGSCFCFSFSRRGAVAHRCAATAWLAPSPPPTLCGAIVWGAVPLCVGHPPTCIPALSPAPAAAPPALTAAGRAGGMTASAQPEPPAAAPAPSALAAPPALAALAAQAALAPVPTAACTS
mmetsp:Transcript_1478/g.5807  ORF Transcript_1478/g.5807 Transcript_1478/m.5807 type:complete len:208 (-) Transcript_1478:189-812(-)